MSLLLRFVAVFGCAMASTSATVAQESPVLRVAVAANFKQTLEKLVQAFGTQRARVLVSSGASGMLYSQVVQGAPFDMYFSADVQRPLELEKRGHIDPGTRFTYATGKLVFWRPRRGTGAPLGSLETELRAPGLKILAIGNPQLSPYGLASKQVLQQAKLWTAAPFRIVQGESLGQAYQFVASGNADAGFIALSQVYESGGLPGSPAKGDLLIVDPDLYALIEQQAVILSGSKNKALARAFFAFIRSDAGRKVITSAGYGT
jgi:molybdate transport system substrate-binding protein